MTGKQKRYLKGLAHDIKPILNIGKHGVTPALQHQVSEALTAHELIKVKVLESCPEDKKTCAEELSTKLEATIVQIIGRTLILFRPHPEDPVIEI